MRALLVGIDAYDDPIKSLGGCVNDMRHLKDYLQVRVGESALIVRLIDADATRAAVIAGFRDHLSQAGPDDVALFAFAGHGSEEPVPDVIAGSESSGKLQNILVADAGLEKDGAMVRPIADKELGLLIAEVAVGGAHVVALMDCCHSGDVTRELSAATTRQWLPKRAEADTSATRSVIDFLLSLRPDAEFLPGALERVGQLTEPDHVALYACQPTELANEDFIGGEKRGAFSAAVLDALATAGPRTTYRSLLAGARGRIEREFESQHPSVFPDRASGPADAPFLGGTIRATPPTLSMTRAVDGWQVDAGEMHGLRSAAGDEAFRLACTGSDGEVAGHVRVVNVIAGTSSVEPEGWEPLDVAYDATIVAAPLPLAAFRFAVGENEPPAELVEAVRRRLASCAPEGGPSPFVRERVDDTTAGSFEFGVSFSPDGDTGSPGPVVRIVRADGSAAIRTSPTIPCGDVELAAVTLVEHLEHLAKWEQRKESSPRAADLFETVQLRLYPREAADKTVPADRQSLVANGQYVVGTDAEGARRLWVQIANTADDELYVALIGLTDDLACAVYSATQQLAPGSPHNIPIKFTLSPGIDVRPGARSQEWLRLIVSTTRFDSSDFELEPVREAGGPATRGKVEVVATEALVDPGWWSTTIGIVLQVPPNTES